MILRYDIDSESVLESIEIVRPVQLNANMNVFCIKNELNATKQ